MADVSGSESGDCLLAHFSKKTQLAQAKLPIPSQALVFVFFSIPFESSISSIETASVDSSASSVSVATASIVSLMIQKMSPLIYGVHLHRWRLVFAKHRAQNRHYRRPKNANRQKLR